MAITDTATHAPTNDTRYEPAASAWTRVDFRVQRASRELEAGTVWIDEHLAIGWETPHGGVNGSGFGKDMSMCALDECELTDEPRKGWYDAVSPR